MRRWYNELLMRTHLAHTTIKQWREMFVPIIVMLTQFQYKAFKLHNNMTTWVEKKEPQRMKDFTEKAFTRMLEDALETYQWKGMMEGKAAAAFVNKRWGSNTGEYVRPLPPIPPEEKIDLNQLLRMQKSGLLISPGFGQRINQLQRGRGRRPQPRRGQPQSRRGQSESRRGQPQSRREQPQPRRGSGNGMQTPSRPRVIP